MGAWGCGHVCMCLFVVIVGHVRRVSRSVHSLKSQNTVCFHLPLWRSGVPENLHVELPGLVGEGLHCLRDRVRLIACALGDLRASVIMNFRFRRFLNPKNH
jgi:hypothetical protein